MTKILIRNTSDDNTTRVVVRERVNGEDEFVVAVLGPGDEHAALVDGDARAIVVHEQPHAPDTLPPEGIPT